MTDEYRGHGWACVDCLMWLANGETDPEMSEEETAAWLANLNERNKGYDITLGLLLEEHVDGCPRKAGDRDAECDCETNSFSWCACDVCDSNLGGERHAVSFWKIKD
jgi:hypothetical protein